MKKIFVYLIIGFLIALVAACDSRTTTDNYLQGEFVESFGDTTQPNMLLPNNNAKITDTEVVLEWSSKQGASFYIVEVASDSGFTNLVHKDGIPVNTITNLETMLTLKVGTDLDVNTDFIFPVFTEVDFPLFSKNF